MAMVRVMRLTAEAAVRFEDDHEGKEVIREVAKHMVDVGAHVSFVKGAIEVREGVQTPLVENLKNQIIEECRDSSLSGICPCDPPVRGPHGEAEIWLREGAKPVSQKPYHMTGERRQAHAQLVDEAMKMGKIEPGSGPWNTPSFPVPKKAPGKYRLVQDLRPQNLATVKDGHPLPQIAHILQRQGQFKIWTVLDLTDGYHQMPLKKEHRHITCMSTPRGTMQWKVLVMGLKNGNAQFQKMMEWVLRDLPGVDPYVDDIIIGSTGGTEEELLQNHAGDVRRVLQRLKENVLVCSPEKISFFHEGS
jgi:hypothetical protein